jgi:hypothetical protein
MEKETILTSGHSKRLKHIRKSVRFIRPKRRIIMAITIPKECPICGTLYHRQNMKNVLTVKVMNLTLVVFFRMFTETD